MAKISVLGAGSWGTALGLLLCNNGHDVTICSENEKEIECAFEQLMKQKTVVVIAHRLNTIAHADQILVMKNGTIAECGTHESLMHEEHSWYQNMVQQQKMAEQWNIKTDYS